MLPGSIFRGIQRAAVLPKSTGIVMPEDLLLSLSRSLPWESEGQAGSCSPTPPQDLAGIYFSLATPVLSIAEESKVLPRNFVVLSRWLHELQKCILGTENNGCLYPHEWGHFGRVFWPNALHISQQIPKYQYHLSFSFFFNEVELDLNFSIDLNRRDKKKRLRKKDTPQNVGIGFSKESCL